jgi:hypothetical protein
VLVSIADEVHPTTPAGSAVSVWRNARGEARWSVRCGCENGRAALEAAAALAVEVDGLLAAHYRAIGKEAAS